MELTEPLTGLAIREFLMAAGEGGPSDFYRSFRKVKPSTSYNSCRRYFWICKKLGLIEPTRRVMGQSPTIAKSLYRIRPGAENDPRWAHPSVAMYPATGLGRRRYRKAKEKGLV